MKLSSGVRLGPYEIVAPIGAGGMGEVYRARDTRLNRIVAVKILPADFADDARLKLRFESEAKAISAINHPHICALYDVGPDYLVMEHCEGKTLAKRIAEGPLPLDQLLDYAMQTADALDKAHRQGIIHRDLKPSNIMITKSGVKLLDFGLAKQRIISSPEESTVGQVTEEGKILGTLQYMAPELFHGKEADARSDVFALGLLLYEMAAGKPAFSADSKAKLIASILRDDPPPLTEITPTSPVALDRLIRNCTSKDPDERIQSAHDVLLDLRSISAEPLRAAKPPSRRRVIAAIAAILIAVVAALAAWKMHLSPSTARPLRRYDIAFPPEAQMDVTGRFSVSSDGKWLAYVSWSNGSVRSIWLRSLENGRIRQLPGTDGALATFFSPDGEWVGFYTINEMKKVSVNGSTATTICRIGDTRGAAWSADDTIIFAPTFGTLSQVPAAGGLPRPLIQKDPRLNRRWPSVLPDGEHVLYTLGDYSGDYEHAQTMVLSLRTGKSALVVDGATCARYGNGHLFFARQGTLFAAPFDVRTQQLTGPRVAVVDDVAGNPTNGVAADAVAEDGTVLYVHRNSPQREMVWLDRKGSFTPIALIPGASQFPRSASISPDQKEIVVDVEDRARVDLWKYDIASDVWTRLTSRGLNWTGKWSPDGKRIVFSCSGDGALNLCTVPSDGGAPPQPLTRQSEAWFYAGSWSADGKQIIVHEEHRGDPGDVGVLDLGPAIRYRRVIATPFEEQGPALSPDGRWLAFWSDETGQDELYVAAYPEVTHRWLISHGVRGFPLWRSDSKELFYTQEDNAQEDKLMAVDVAARSGKPFGKPHKIASDPSSDVIYDVSADGQRFLINRSKTRYLPANISVIVGAVSSQ